jgi:CheY-like chemotaxis protein
LNNALAPILMGLQLLQKERQDDETQRMLAVMESNTHRGADMVKQVLLFARGRDGEKEPLALGSLLHEMERIVRQTFPKSINVAALAPADLWPVLGNATQLHQVLLNLCVNARDAMPGGGELTLAADNVELTPAEAKLIPQGAPGRYVMLLVSDTGSGISPEVLPRIFEPFFTTKPVGEGTGLGLSTSARILSQHGGFLNVRSEPDQGTTFELYLPCATIAPTPATQRPPSAEIPHGHGETLLLVDDEQAIREMISSTLTEHGYRILTAANGAEALLCLENSADTVRLVLLDHDMPVMNGRETLTALHARWPQLRVLLMSGEMESQEFSRTATLSKPFQLQQLLQAVGEQLG